MTEQELDKIAREEILYNEQKREWWKQGARFIIENQLAEKDKRIEECLAEALLIIWKAEFENRIDYLENRQKWIKLSHNQEAELKRLKKLIAAS